MPTAFSFPALSRRSLRYRRYVKVVTSTIGTPTANATASPILALESNPARLLESKGAVELGDRWAVVVRIMLVWWYVGLPVRVGLPVGLPVELLDETRELDWRTVDEDFGLLEEADVIIGVEIEGISGKMLLAASARAVQAFGKI